MLDQQKIDEIKKLIEESSLSEEEKKEWLELLLAMNPEQLEALKQNLTVSKAIERALELTKKALELIQRQKGEEPEEKEGFSLRQKGPFGLKDDLHKVKEELKDLKKEEDEDIEKVLANEKKILEMQKRDEEKINQIMSQLKSLRQNVQDGQTGN